MDTLNDETPLFNDGIDRKQRIQVSIKSCEILAPMLMQGYLIKKHTGQWEGTMDLSKYIRNRFDTKQIEKYLLGGGGDRLKLMKDLLATQ